MSRREVTTGKAEDAMRWWIPGPGEDESLRSVVERAERMYGGEGDTFRRRLWLRATDLPSDATALDVLSARELCELGRIIGAEPRELFFHRLVDDPMLLKPTERRAYCPLCWAEDRKEGRPPAYRRAWAGIFSLRCVKHGAWLQWASPQQSMDSAIAGVIQPPTASGIRILKFIESFAAQMERSLLGVAPWPCGWRGDAFSARALLMRCTTNLGCLREHPPYGSISGPPDLTSFVRPPAHRLEPLRGQPWEHVRTLGPPPWRRAALWMVAAYVIASPKPGVLPEGLPMDPFAALEGQWESVPSDFRGMRRTQRYRAALASMCKPFPVRRAR